jgi:predicted aldo/keto reductase-like oxidoreductase
MKSKNTSRRAFLSSGLILPVVAASSRIGLADPTTGIWPESADAPSGAPAKLAFRTLGRTGLRVTTVGFGCMTTTDPSVIERAVDMGVTYFDTARSYQHGNNERMVGAALGANRKNLILSTKTEASDKAGLQNHLDTSLRELKTDYIDVWYLHAHDTTEEVNDEMIEFQQLAKKQGKIRFAGLSTHRPERLLPFLVQKGTFDVALTVYNFAMEPGVEQAIAVAARSGMGIVGMKVMAGGFKDIRPSDPAYSKLKRDGAMLAALKWTLKNPLISTTIPGTTDMDQLEENVKAMAHPFESADEKVLAAHIDAIKPLYCRMCGQCDGACQKGLPVADMLRILTYADGYRQFALGRERFQHLSAEHRAVRCGDCAECTVQCPHGVRVSDRLTRAQELFA